MTTRVAIAVLAMLICPPVTSSVTAQEPAAKPAPPARSAVTAMVIDVTISRHLGDKLLSSTPYQLSVIPKNRSQLRMGGDVPVPTMTFTPGQKDDSKPNPLTSFSYRSIGTNIDVIAGDVTDGRYEVGLIIEETSIYPPELAPPSTKATGASAFRNFKSSNTIALRDGQSLGYTMATDRISGEVYRVSVKLTVVK